MTPERIAEIERLMEAARTAVPELVQEVRRLQANQLTEGFIEACPGCGVPRFYGNGDKGSDGGCDGFVDHSDNTGIACPLKPHTGSAGT